VTSLNTATLSWAESIMSGTFNPVAFVESIRRADEEARDSLRALCLGPVERLVDRVVGKHRPQVERKVLVPLQALILG
jgi:hypothetical protein